MKSFRFSGRAAVVCSLILAIGIPSVAVGFGEGRSLLRGKRNPSSNSNLALSTETEIIANSATYGTRQSNKRTATAAARSTAAARTRQRALHPRREPQGRPRLRVRDRRPRDRPDRGRQHRRRAVHHQRDRRRHRPERRQGRRQGGGRLRRRRRPTAPVREGHRPGRGRPDRSRAAVRPRPLRPATYTVTFNKDVSACSSTASATGTDATGAVRRCGAANTQITVSREAADPDTSFQLQVIC